jgi:hypothetical protein
MLYNIRQGKDDVEAIVDTDRCRKFLFYSLYREYMIKAVRKIYTDFSNRSNNWTRPEYRTQTIAVQYLARLLQTAFFLESRFTLCNKQREKC